MAYLGYFVGIAGIAIGIVIGFLSGTNPTQAGLILFVPAAIVFFFKNFELSVIGLLVLRSALDPFSDKGVTGAFAIAVSALAILYTTSRLLNKQPVKFDAFWWFFIGWVLIQALWVVLLPMGAFELGSARLPEAIREWLRILSWSMVYLLTLQLKDKVSPERFIGYMFLALVLPVVTSFLQLLVPGHLLPYFLAVNPNQDGFRINGTLGVANTFVSFLIFFIGLTYWKLGVSKNRLPWILLISSLVFLLVTTKVLVGIIMLMVLLAVLIVPRLRFTNLVGAIVLATLMLVLFASTDVGRERLASIAQTPLLNPDIDVSRAILLSSSDGNSFNWRVTQWYSLIGFWKQSPILGHGLQTANAFPPMMAYAHNDYVRVLVEEGIVGFMLFFAFLGVQLSRLVMLMRSPLTERSQKSFCAVLIAFLLAAMAGMLTENIWSHTAVFFYWFSLSAIADWKWEKAQDKPEPMLEERLAHFG
jgi:O-antigen ligase